jgi:UDP-GlcNAc3NAcA epimerase
MTARMMERLEPILLSERPDWVVVYGDTNSTLAAALTAVKLHLPVAHVEAGLRSFNMRMPEEVNRIVTDAVSGLLLCPTEASVNNLMREGRRAGILHVGDVMYDAALLYAGVAAEAYPLARWGVEPGRYVLSTIHRAENTDDPIRFKAIWDGLLRIAEDLPVLFPAHPRTRLLFGDLIAGGHTAIHIIEPVSYLEMLRLESSAHAIVTDSGGVQKEAFFHRVPCFTVRDETEWLETVELGWNVLCGADADRLVLAWRHRHSISRSEQALPFGDGHAAARIVAELTRPRKDSGGLRSADTRW